MKKIVISWFAFLILLPIPVLAYGEWPFSAMQSEIIDFMGQGVRIAVIDTGSVARNLLVCRSVNGYVTNSVYSPKWM